VKHNRNDSNEVGRSVLEAGFEALDLLGLLFEGLASLF
jgi:hypothetical protein